MTFDDKTDDMLKVYIVILISILIAISPINLPGQKIYSCESKYDADVKIFVVESKYDADLLVYKEESKYNADGNKGLWFFTESKYEADKKIYFTESKYDADLLIYFVESKYDAQWRERSKMYLMY